MESKDILWTRGKNDECRTQSYGVRPILKYIPRGKVIWCPFDREDSRFVKMISKTNRVIYSHIDYGQDYYIYEPDEHWDMIISNPPFTNKRKIFERAISFNKPFALIMTLTIFNDKYPCWSFKEADRSFQLLKFDKRMEFINMESEVKKKITFQSGYICSDFLPQDFIMETLDKT